MADQKAFIYTEKYFDYDYGPHHPLRVERLKLTYDLIEAYGLLDLPDVIRLETVPAELADVCRFHRGEYVDTLRQCSRGGYDPSAVGAFGLGPGDNPVFSGLWEWSLLTTGASLMCARLLAEKKVGIAYNMAGGLHHAMAGRASGFCYINDIVVAIQALLDQGLRVVYVDVDAHHGDGVQEAFYDTDQVLTVSLHQHGRTLFPGTGFVYDTGRGAGQGFSVNLPMFPGTDDELFLEVFSPLVEELVAAYDPDVLVTQLGVDTFRTDPLTSLCLTTNGFEAAIRIFKSLGKPWLALGGGGYHIVNVARAWTLAWAIINDTSPPDALPQRFLDQIRGRGYREEYLRDRPYRSEGASRKDAQTAARQIVDTIRRTCLPVVAGAGRR
jgi:acetoin utilization protein AcuC